jgi:lipoprotein signal peptidase
MEFLEYFVIKNELSIFDLMIYIGCILAFIEIAFSSKKRSNNRSERLKERK